MNKKMKRPLGLALTVCLVLSLLAGSAYAINRYFEDAKGHWAEEAIQILTEKGVISGYPDGLAHPDEIITRGEFAALVARTMELPEPEESEVTIHFTDIAGHWSEPHIEALIIAGIIQKDDFGTEFQPDQPITRMEMIRMLVRAIGKGDHDASCPCVTGFSDDGTLSEVDKSSICTGKEYGIVDGYPDGTVKPDGKATRAEAFEMLVDTEKAKEQIKKEEPPKPTVPAKPEDQPSDGNSGGGSSSGSGSGGGGSSYVPAPQFSFTLPKTAYTADEIEIKPESHSVSSVTWSALKNGLPTGLSELTDGTLDHNGGKVKFTQTGSITLIATAKNSRGVTVTHEQTISIYPVVTAAFTLPETTHTDKSVAVELSTENLGSNAVVWSLEKDGSAVDVETALAGTLDSTGGTVLFKEKGSYTLTASITDELGKVITAQDSITVYPVAEVKLTLPAVSHTDKTVALKTETKETDGLTVAYTLTRNGEPAETDTWIEGNPADGSIRFKEKGVYALTASVTDDTGRVFADTVNITVYPVGSAGFYLPEIFHTDSTVMVEAVFGEIGSHTAKWTLLRDGKEVSLTDTVEGTLGNNGGELKFRTKGSYVLKAEFTDDGSRTYHYEQGFKVYPVPAVRYSLPEYVHTDTDIAVKTETADLDGLTVEWLVDNTYGFQDWPTYVDGTLTNGGGTIRFKRAGVYELAARVTDETGRVFLYESHDKCEVLPVLTLGFELPEFAYTDTAIDLRTHGNNQVLPVEWSVTKDGKSIPLSEAFSGELTAQGGKITFKDDGEYVLTATMTDYLKRSYSHSESIRILPVVQYAFTMPQTVHYGTEFEVAAKDVQYLGSYAVVWTLEKDKNAASYQGSLGNDGGKIAIRDTGAFTLTASVTDRAGRVTTYSERITVTNTAPNAPVVEAVPTRTAKDGKFLVNITASATDPDGDAVTLEYADTAADSYYAPGTHTIRVRAKDIAGAYSPWTEKTFTVTNAAPTGTLTAEPTRTVKDDKFLVNISATATDADGDATTLEWDNKAADGYYAPGTHTVKVRAKDIAGAYSPWVEKTFTITSSAPTVTLTATPTRTANNGKFLVNISATAADADGDATTLEWDNKAADGYYAVGTHTVRVRAKDATGLYSEWVSKTFAIANSAPTAPVITRTPNGNSVAPGTPVTITAASSDPDGDPVALIWEGRNAETQTYPRGKNVVRVKAVDSTGAESPWAAIVFFVADSNGGGGMTLTGPDSVIMENGIEGATITEYTFTVPPVSGHSGSDFGRVRGYNKLTGQWDQLDYGTTSNGITFTRTLGAGVYTQLEFYYYTNHNCMYNKSNITYSVTYHFE
ncbi:S-layer homology domain-containing protein [Youngiibacter fragilis]|uniref:S-layer protein n=1 Tax=Youngiibacter fragilis 232.1 TaxID=994573 RepID=V7I6A6_9CLOT|nr:S-layer homology domain-containing protein [Youngiibacter fragilis]ETA81745.1 S-layer protein [Youngiibacter fragilis 232.1]